MPIIEIGGLPDAKSLEQKATIVAEIKKAVMSIRRLYLDEKDITVQMVPNGFAPFVTREQEISIQVKALIETPFRTPAVLNALQSRLTKKVFRLFPHAHLVECLPIQTVPKDTILVMRR